MDYRQTQINMGWYHVNVDWANDRVAPIVDIDALAKALPHGSGIDGNWYIRVRDDGNLVVTGEYHAMNDNGYYCGWRTFAFRIQRERKHRFNPLIGPCAGLVQVFPSKGDITMSCVRGAGDANEYLDETIEYTLSEAGLLTNGMGQTVSVETARLMGWKEVQAA